MCSPGKAAEFSDDGEERGRQGWLPGFSLSNETDGSAIDGVRKDPGRGRREGREKK